MKTVLGRRRRQAGNAMMELAIGVSILSAAFTGTFQFGYTFYRYDNLQTAVNNGAHYAALLAWDSTDGTMTTAYKTAVQNMVAFGDPTGTTTTPVLPNLKASNVTVTANGQSGTGPQPPVSITVAITDYKIDSVFGTMTCSNRPSVTYPFQGFVTDGY